ncbi:choline ABC transporter ATP-binding protein [Marinobacterium mangrovicola]|uniref:Glycine betaine/proline transport system ATP-binding protein n=1 Tax=Marinobacterium mangrovicola TaxID=1476959 RepID=A0A4R1G7U9_9GAMM|nr:choline ABC transporter ATP-binding protein [Marinobacterium mangrovicola]TCK02620.1 glycine betaine/proline transport system ATP-binding protein [Marinobacterium mangrovicola]
MAAVEIKDLDVVFGNNQAQTLSLIDQGLSRQEILEKTGDVVGVQGASLSVNEGEICVLMGLSGSGKSSLLRAVNGLNQVSRGSLEVQDGDARVDLANCNAQTLRHLRSKRISMVFQKFALMPWLSVVDNVAFGLEMQNVGKKERRRRALEKLEMVGLSEWQDKFPHELSGGMQQRVGLARAFTMDSDILLMDEPFSALDPLIRAQLQDELIELQERMKKTILFVSHDLDEALKIGSHIAIMESARIIQHGKPEDIVLNPSNAYVEDFVAHTNPLNVLRGRSLMTDVSDMALSNNSLTLNARENSQVQLESGRPISATRGEVALAVTPWNESESLDKVAENMLMVTTPEVSMRNAIELRYRSGQPVLLAEDNKVVGMLSDRDFYHALLGKHFTQDSNSEADAA